MELIHHFQEFRGNRAGPLSPSSPGPFDEVFVATGDTIELLDAGAKRFVRFDQNGAGATYATKDAPILSTWEQIRLTGSVKVDSIPTTSGGYSGMVAIETTNNVTLCSLLCLNNGGAFAYQGFLGNPPSTSSPVAGILGFDANLDMRYIRFPTGRLLEVRLAGILVISMADPNAGWEPDGGKIRISMGRFPSSNKAGADFSLRNVVVHTVQGVPRELILENSR